MAFPQFPIFVQHQIGLPEKGPITNYGALIFQQIPDTLHQLLTELQSFKDDLSVVHESTNK